MSHQSNCEKCGTNVNWTGMSDRTINVLEDGFLITGILVWNKENTTWRIICRACLQKIAFK